ncbi:hypothetical protein Thal_0932 [Thermocrinis albus DSM 14484]|uniref:Polymerase/histidinol phosphatase N-terminal domain-containing protein n=1 Tax=Thermocrinis albus (strain DSM 14484 / JCM 11386 / HI 11/12) TaxID=638303 RepID=D3SLD4_THEAH|nr:PHP domain-containing protein [Thermocrinis albus]ADC89564.1 hypothetical protein Thal_0932 [Thermocrinis albus DSM 14484]
MMLYILLPFLLLGLWILLAYLLPVRYARASRQDLLPSEVPNLYLYSYQLHLHTQFSYDSLGKPEDIRRAMEEEDVNFVFITDHENDYIKYFCDERMLAGIERKTEEGAVLCIGPVKVIAHPFKEKYRWKGNREGFLLELIDLKDSLLENKGRLLFYLVPVILLYPFLKDKALRLLRKVVKVEEYADRYYQEGWKNPVVGGLDHHVKVYVREVGIRFLFPHYRHSFSLMRNIFISPVELKTAQHLAQMLLKQEGTNVICFDKKPPIVYREGKKVHLLYPYTNLLVKVRTPRESRWVSGSNLVVEERDQFLLGYSFLFRLGNTFWGLCPSFIIKV